MGKPIQEQLKDLRNKIKVLTITNKANERVIDGLRRELKDRTEHGWKSLIEWIREKVNKI